MTCSSSDCAAPFAAVVPSGEVMSRSVLSFAGEMGIVSSGTGELDLVVVDAVTGADMAGVAIRKQQWRQSVEVRVRGRGILAALRPW